MPRGRSGGPPSKTQRDRYRERVDREAAAIILQDELDARREPRRERVTVRSGRGPREPEMPSWRASRRPRAIRPVASQRAGRADRRDAASALPGIVKFLLFAGVLAGRRAPRPADRAAPGRPRRRRRLGVGQPGAIARFPFVADLVREDLGDALTTRRGAMRPSGVFTVNPGDTDQRPRAAARQPSGYVASERAFLYLGARDRRSMRSSPSGSFLPAQEHDPEEVADALVDGRRHRDHDPNITFREGLRIEQMTALLQTLDTSGIDPQGVLRAGEAPAGGAPRRLRVAAPAQGREPRGLPLPGHL